MANAMLLYSTTLNCLSMIRCFTFVITISSGTTSNTAMVQDALAFWVSHYNQHFTHVLVPANLIMDVIQILNTRPKKKAICTISLYGIYN
ncbi:hypothetical protein HDV63DRAFT_32097 [Trichoderma sp. SZMC 28014]